jgi:pimeloyl-ACP methyl ester carboxylesterase
MSCCCPPAISAIFCLWARSGFSQSSVAGALTFFPPDPALYKFTRTLDGVELPDSSEDEKDDESDEKETNNDNVEKPKPTNVEEAATNDSPGAAATESEEPKEVHPAQALTERALLMRKRAKKRNMRDAEDRTRGVKYTFVPDPRLATPPSSTGTLEAIKVPHLGNNLRASRRSHVACTVYRIRQERVTETTKTIIYSHGNATDIGAMHFMQVIIAKGLKCNVVMYDYSGYGESGGVSLESNTYSDIEAVYDYVLNNVVTDKNERSIILYGQSVGGGPSCYLAAKTPGVGGLILHSAFLSGMRVLTPNRALACLDIFPNLTRIKKVNCPVFIIHGMLDEEVAFIHGKTLQDAVPDDCKRTPWWVKDRGHNDITDGRVKVLEYIQKLKVYFESLDQD